MQMALETRQLAAMETQLETETSTATTPERRRVTGTAVVEMVAMEMPRTD